MLSKDSVLADWRQMSFD